MSSKEISIKVENLAKNYRLFGHPGDRIKQALTLGRVKFHREFTSLNDVSLEVKSGERVGIIGRNGSGKSTLLQLICGILKPTRGKVHVRGSIAALLELGAGFNPEFTGKENVYFQGAVMGYTREEIDRRFPEIAAFADIGDYIDQPVRTYSSGMFVRLAFSAMIHTDADILVIDEALAVGDEAFQRKCFDKLTDYLEGKDKILLFVSHNIRQIERVCSKTVWLDAGSIKQIGDPVTVCGTYYDNIQKNHESLGESSKPRANVAYSGEVDINSLAIYNGSDHMPASQIEIHSPVKVVMEVNCHKEFTKSEIVIGIHTTDSIMLGTATTGTNSVHGGLTKGINRVECLFPDMMLLPGVYQLRIAIYDGFRRALWVGQRLSSFCVTTPTGSDATRIPEGFIDLPYSWKIDKA